MNQLPERLTRTIDEQRKRIEQHSEKDGANFERIVKTLPVLTAQLCLGDFLGALVVDHKPRVLYRYRVGEGSPAAALGSEVVLKVYGDRPRGEGPLQQLWQTRNLSVPRLMCGEADECSWLLIEYLNFVPLRNEACDRFELGDELARMGSAMHLPDENVTGVLRPLARVMAPRWQQSRRALLEFGYSVPSSWFAKALTAYEGGNPVPLHGDIALANMGRIEDGRLIVFDASALRGDASFDAARWSARAGTRNANPEALLEQWATIEVFSEDQKRWDLLAAECVLEAGSRAIVQSRVTGSCTPAVTDTNCLAISDLLDVTSRQWS